MVATAESLPVGATDPSVRSGLIKQNKHTKNDECHPKFTNGRKISSAKAEDVPMFDSKELPTSTNQVIGLQAENLELRERIAMLEAQLVDKATSGSDSNESEYTRLLEEKTDLIRELHLKIQELEATTTEQARHQAAELPNETDLIALSEELERERNQLQEDERALMQQMRVLEVQMSRERAELARQRADVERLHYQVQHELELANKEASMRERLQPLMQQRQGLLRNGSAAPPPRTPTNGDSKPVPSRGSGTGSGLFRRLFGAG
jgi:hypothetical protein